MVLGLGDYLESFRHILYKSLKRKLQ